MTKTMNTTENFLNERRKHAAKRGVCSSCGKRAPLYPAGALGNKPGELACARCLRMEAVTDDFLEAAALHEVSTKGGKATVAVFLMVLSSKIVQSDAAQMKRDMKRGIASNPYALGHMLAAKDKVEAEVKSVLHNDDEESLRKLQKSLKRHFTGTSPVAYTSKAIDKYIATGKIPKISGKGGAAPAWK